MLRPRDEMLGQVTDAFANEAWNGTFIGSDTGVSFVVRHEAAAAISWSELESAEDLVSLARERFASVVGG